MGLHRARGAELVEGTLGHAGKYGRHRVVPPLKLKARFYLLLGSQVYSIGRPLSRDVLFSFRSSSQQLGCTIAALIAQQPLEHVKNALHHD